MNNEVLNRASREGDIDLLYTVIQQNPDVLKRIDEEMFEDTPLHEAASAGHSHFAKEVMNLMPSFAKKLNKQGLSPMLLALQNKHYKLVLFLLRADPDLVRVKGRNGITPLHFAAEHGYSNLVSHFLLACPKCIEDINIHGDTALHVSVKNYSLEVVGVIVGWLERVCHVDALLWNKYIPKWRNEQGRTALDIAQSNDYTEAVKLLTRECAELEDSSSHGRGVLVARYLRSKVSYQEIVAVSILRRKMRVSDNVSNALLVVAGLVLAASFQMVYNPPAGFKESTQFMESRSEAGVHINTVPERTKAAMHPGNFALIATIDSSILYLAIWAIVFLLTDVKYGILISIFLLYLLVSYSLSLVAIVPTFRSSVAFAVLLGVGWLLLLLTIVVFWWGKRKLKQLLDYAPNNNIINMCPREETAVGHEIRGSTTVNANANANHNIAILSSPSSARILV